MKLDSPLLIALNIAGDKFDVVFDGESVTSPVFPGQLIDYVAPCGLHVTQELLLRVCVRKLQELFESYPYIQLQTHLA